MELVDHLDHNLLCQYQNLRDGGGRGGGVLYVKDWTEGEQRRALGQVPHQSKMAHISFLWEYFDSMVVTVQLVVLTYLVAKELPGLRLVTL